MSQQLVPIDGGVQKIETTTSQSQLLVLSQQYIDVKGLEERPTEWVAGGRPIYRRLPGVSETYQVDFFNIVPAPNTAATAEVQDIGYVYTPWGGSQFGANSLEVISSEEGKDILIQSGEIVWRYGKTLVRPTIINLEILEVLSGQYEVAYQLLYDDSPLQKLYSVTDFSLCGEPLNITSGTDSIIGWRYPAVNAFLNSSTKKWSNHDGWFPSLAPSPAFLQWESDLPMAYSKVTLRCPENSVHTGSATLSYVSGSTITPIVVSEIKSDSSGQFFEFTLDQPSYQLGWNIEFTDSNISIANVFVSGIITLLESQAAPSTRAVLVMYPTGSLPKTVVNESGKTIPATYCPLAYIDVDSAYQITKVKDARYIIHRDYVPVSDWLTKPFDDNLISLYEQVDDFPNLWLAPNTCMKQEYVALSEEQITVIG